MGAWGPAIFSNDTASDVKDDFRDYIGDGMSPEKAVAKLVEEYSPIEDDLEEYCPFWLGLAAVQFQTGRLIDQVKDIALKIIDSGHDLSLWEGNCDLKKRKVALDKLKSQLLGEQKKTTKVKKRFKEVCEWPVGTILAYKLKEGDYVPFRVAAIHTDKGGDQPEIEVLAWKYSRVPEESELVDCDVLEYAIAMGGTRLLVCQSGVRCLPKDRLEVVCIGDGTEMPWSSPLVTGWRELDGYLYQCYGLE